MSEYRPTVGFIGLGSQGGPMAAAVIADGFDTILWARREESLAPYRGSASFAGSPAELAAQSDVIGVCVLSDEDVDDVVLREDGVLAGVREGAVMAVHSTTHPETCIRLSTALTGRGAHVLDAPVSGGGAAASERRLLVMVGGDSAVFELVLPVLSSFGNPVLHLGPVGAGQVAKLVNNLLLTANLSLADEALRLGSALGLEDDALVVALQHGSSRSFGLDMYSGLRRSFGGSSDGIRTVAALLGKDVGLMGRLTADSAVDAGPLLGPARRVLEAMVGGDQGDPLAPADPPSGALAAE